MKARTLKVWIFIHKWSSLISSAFLLVLFVSGLALVYRAEIDGLMGFHNDHDSHANRTAVSIDQLVDAGIQRFPDKVVQYIVWNQDTPNTVLLAMAPAAGADFRELHNVLIDANTAKIIQTKTAPMDIILELHASFFLKSFGPIVLGLVSILFLLALVSGAVIYSPFLKKRVHGELKTSRRQRLRWLDFHNISGMLILAWALVVGGTGLINSWGEYITMIWRADQLTEITHLYKDKPIPDKLISVDKAMASALTVTTDMKPYFVAFPQSFMTTPYHYAIFMRGTTASTHYLLKPIIIDAANGEITSSQDLPMYMKGLFLSQPLHFGDYGGEPLKLIWALFTLLSIAILLTGFYLTISKNKAGKNVVS